MASYFGFEIVLDEGSNSIRPNFAGLFVSGYCSATLQNNNKILKQELLTNK